MKKGLFKLIVLLLLSFVFLFGCSSNKDDDEAKEEEPKNTEESSSAVLFDASSCISLSFYGYDGLGVAEVERDSAALSVIREELLKKVEEQEKASKNDDESEEEENNSEAMRYSIISAINSISLVVTPNTDLKNGDTVTVKININEAQAKKCNIALEKSEYTYSVSGLKVLQKIDPFEGLTVQFSGSEKNASVKLNNDGCSDFVRNYVLYQYGAENGWRNGEKLTVTAYWGDNFRNHDDSELYAFTESKKEFVISGLTVFPKKMEGIDMTPVVNNAMSQMNSELTDHLYNYVRNAGWVTTIKFNSIEIATPVDETYKISGFALSVEKAYFLQPKENTDVQSKVIVIGRLHYNVNAKAKSSANYDKFPMQIDTFAVGYAENFEVDEHNVLVNVGDFYNVENTWGEQCRNVIDFDTAYARYVQPETGKYLAIEIKTEEKNNEQKPVTPTPSVSKESEDIALIDKYMTAAEKVAADPEAKCNGEKFSMHFDGVECHCMPYSGVVYELELLEKWRQTLGIDVKDKEDVNYVDFRLKDESFGSLNGDIVGYSNNGVLEWRYSAGVKDLIESFPEFKEKWKLTEGLINDML